MSPGKNKTKTKKLKGQIISSQRAYLHLIVANFDEIGPRIKPSKDSPVSSRYSPWSICIYPNMQTLSVVKCRESVCLGIKISGDQRMTAKTCKRKTWPREVFFFKSKFIRLEAGLEKKCARDNEERGATENSRSPQGLWKPEEECQFTAKVTF